MQVKCPTNKGLKTLTKTLFNLELKVDAIKVDKKQTFKIMKQFNILNIPRLKPIINYSTYNLILLSSPTPDSTYSPIIHTLHLDYDYWSVNDILSSILPDNLTPPSGFQTIGHIAHFNLDDSLQEYKHIIGEVIHSKYENIKTVISKTDSISNEFRVFKFDLLFGDDDYKTTVTESKCLFQLDYEKCYWNSKLSTEHDRIIKSIDSNHIVCDVFGGIGPFSVPLSKSGTICFTNDKNPDSFKYLEKNIILNKVAHLIVPYNLDGRDFIKKSLLDLNSGVVNTLHERYLHPKTRHGDIKTPTFKTIKNDEFNSFDVYIMNLPAIAIEFLDAFQGLYSSFNADVIKQPTVYVYCFSKEKDSVKQKQDVLGRIEDVLKCELGNDFISIHTVRNVAPNKDMLCVCFKVPVSVLIKKEECNKKRRVEA